MLRSKRCIVQIVVEKLKMENVIALIVERKHLMNMNLINIEYIMQFLDVVFQCVLFYQLLRLEFMDFIGFNVNTLTGEEDSSGFKVLILSIITLGLYELYWLYKVGERLSDFQTYQGEMVDSYRALVYLILGIFGLNIVARALIQNDLNKYAYDS